MMIDAAFEHFIVFYTKDVENGTHRVEHMIGYEDPPTYDVVGLAIQEVKDENLLPNEPVFMVQLDRETALLSLGMD